MKVLLLSPLPPPAGGIATWTKLYMDSQEATKHDVNLVNIAVNGNRINNFTKRNIKDEITRTNYIYKQVKSHLNSKEYDVVHLNTSCSKFGIIRDYLCARKVKSKHTKLIINFHCDTSYMVKGKVVEYFFKKICRKADKIMCLNTGSQSHIENLTQKESIIIPNFFDNKLVSETFEKKISPKINNVIYVGHIVKSKGCDDILSVAKKMPNINFKMIGYLSEEIKSIPTSDNVKYFGEIPKENVLNEMRNADLLLFPTHTEGFPNVILESMACGLPIISTPVGAIPDMLENKGGVFVDVGDTEAMIESIKDLNDADTRKDISKWNINKVKRSYSVDIITRKIFEEYAKECK